MADFVHKVQLTTMALMRSQWAIEHRFDTVVRHVQLLIDESSSRNLKTESIHWYKLLTCGWICVEYIQVDLYTIRQADSLRIIKKDVFNICLDKLITIEWTCQKPYSSNLGGWKLQRKFAKKWNLKKHNFSKILKTDFS